MSARGLAVGARTMSAQHTPGPWKYTHDAFAGHYDIATHDPAKGSEAIGKVHYVANSPGGRGEADARLIAEAPAMLEALRKIHEIAMPGQEMDIGSAIDALCACWNESRAILARIEGGEQ